MHCSVRVSERTDIYIVTMAQTKVISGSRAQPALMSSPIDFPCVQYGQALDRLLAKMISMRSVISQHIWSTGGATDQLVGKTCASKRAASRQLSAGLS